MFFLLAYTGALVALYRLRTQDLTVEGIKRRVSLARLGATFMAVFAWLTVATGTYIVYPWYRAAPPEGTTDLSSYPRSLLLSDPSTDGWHTFGMEWKEHIAWIAPILATAVVFIVWRYGDALSSNPRIRRISMLVLTLAFFAAGVAGLFGGLITKAAPVK
jgi:hypothetical protein